MAIYRPDIKPPTWGSPDAMLYAVRANAEQMELDHRKFLHLFPMLEGAGLQTFDFGAGVNRATNFNVWKEGGPVCQRNTNRDINIPSDSWWFYGPYTEGLSIIARHRGTSSAPSEQYIFSRGTTASAPRAPVGLYQTSALNDSVLLCKSATATRSITASKSFPFGTYITAGATITPQKIFSAYAGEVVNSVDYSSETWGGTTSDAAVVYNKQGTFDRDPNIIGGCVYVIKEALTYDKMQEMFATPYALFMPVSRPVYFDLGAGGTTHEAALTLSADGTLAPGAAAEFSAALALTAEGGISDASAAEYSAAWQAAAQAALVPGGAAVLFAGLALSGSGSLSASATASYAAALGLPVSADLAPSYGSIVTAALALEAVGAMSPAARADYQATLAALAQAGMSAAAAAQLSASWQATVVAALLASTTGLAIDAGVTLPCAAALSATGYAELAAALSLSTGASIDPAALQTAFAGLEFSVLAALAATHPDDVATVMRVLVLFRGASPGVDLSGKSPSITIQ